MVKGRVDPRSYRQQSPVKMTKQLVNTLSVVRIRSYQDLEMWLVKGMPDSKAQILCITASSLGKPSSGILQAGLPFWRSLSKPLSESGDSARNDAGQKTWLVLGTHAGWGQESG